MIAILAFVISSLALYYMAARRPWAIVIHNVGWVDRILEFLDKEFSSRNVKYVKTHTGKIGVIEFVKGYKEYEVKVLEPFSAIITLREWEDRKPHTLIGVSPKPGKASRELREIMVKLFSELGVDVGVKHWR